MKNKIIIFLIPCIILVSIIVFLIYSYLTPNCDLGGITFRAAYSGENVAHINLYNNSFNYQGKFRFLPIPQEYEIRQSMMITNNESVLEEIEEKQYVMPTVIDVEITTKEDSTTIRYFGDAITRDGKEEFYERIIEFDFALPDGHVMSYGEIKKSD